MFLEAQTNGRDFQAREGESERNKENPGQEFQLK